MLAAKSTARKTAMKKYPLRLCNNLALTFRKHVIPVEVNVLWYSYRELTR